MPRWQELSFEAPKMRAAAEEKGVEPILKYTTEFNTRDEVEKAAFIEYLMHPLDVLCGDLESIENKAVAAELSGLTMEGVDRSWRVVTVIQNHHRGLNPRINMFTATKSKEEKTVHQDIYKQNES